MLEQALKEIRRGVSEIIDEERVIALVKNFLEKGETFLVKAGFDPECGYSELVPRWVEQLCGVHNTELEHFIIETEINLEDSALRLSELAATVAASAPVT